MSLCWLPGNVTVMTGLHEVNFGLGKILFDLNCHLPVIYSELAGPRGENVFDTLRDNCPLLK